MAGLLKRNGIYYALYYAGTRQKRISLRTDNYQIAKAKLAELEHAQAQGHDSPLPTRTPIESVLEKYAHYIRSHKTPKSAQTDIYYLRSAFGAICQALTVTSRKLSPTRNKRPAKTADTGKPCKIPTIEAACFEAVTSAQISEFLATQVQAKGLAPKTANRYREILCRLFNWAMAEGGVKMPGDKNPASAVRRYKQKASEIRFLTLAQIDEQLNALGEYPQYQAMIAMYIYAGLRREELLWLQMEDINLRAGKYGMLRIRAKTFNGEYWQPKTAQNRAVPISSTLRGYLDNYCPRPCMGGWYFPSPQACRYDADNFSSDFARIQKTAGLKWTCLDFRHTFGSQLAMKGESLYKISTLMGNSPEICRIHYAALIPEQLGDCVEFGNAEARRIISV